ncbi:MAG TPA: hypothetical protein PKG95_13105 [Anaerolineaceae bacterium]|nr:hypothetical protein [Anaerolineaceae bacterium]
MEPRYERNIDEISDRFDDSLNAFDQANLFTGPSLYFHQQTIAFRKTHLHVTEAIYDQSLMEALYATLTAWGMHRMGKTQAKLCDFHRMWNSFKQAAEFLQGFENYRLMDLSENEISTITAAVWAAISQLEVGIGQVKLVGGAKALHHILPDLVPPIDREYTLQVLLGNKRIKETGWQEFALVFPQLHQMARRNRERVLQALAHRGGMNSSATKILDNALIGYRLLKKQNTPAPAVPLEKAERGRRVMQTGIPTTIPEQILIAMQQLTTAGKMRFSRVDIRDTLQIQSDVFNASYNPIIQAMRIDQPGGAPNIAPKYQGVFRQIERGVYELTEYGLKLIGRIRSK